MTIKKHFSKKLINDATLSIIHFTIKWNGASQIVSMIYNDLAEAYNGSANFYKVNFEEESNLSKELGVTEIPTILFFKSGELIDHAVGLISKKELTTKIEIALSNNKK